MATREDSGGLGAELHHTRSRSELEQEEVRSHWSQARRLCAAVSESKRFEVTISLCIGLNFVLMVMEADQNASCVGVSDEDCSPDSWLQASNTALLIIYTFECILKLFAFRQSFFRTRWNNIDFAIVVLGSLDFLVSNIGLSIPNMSFMRMFRIARLVRAVRILTAFRELYIMVHGFASAMMAMFWGFVMMSLLLTVWSILAVELVHPQNMKIDHSDEWCADVFSSVMMSNLMFFQTVVAGDSWGSCAIPIIENQPLFFPLFAGVLFTVQIGFTNLILAVIVEQAGAARQADKARQLLEQKKQEKVSKAKLLKCCKDIDEDNSGELTLKELQDGFRFDPEFAMHLELLGVEGEMLSEIFEIMDRDGSGSLTYAEFIDAIHRTKSQDVKMLITMVKYELFSELEIVKAEMDILVQKLRRASESKDAQDQDLAQLSPSNLQPQTPQEPSMPSNASPSCIEGAKPSEDAQLFLETLRVQMSYMLDSITSKVREQSGGEEKSKIDTSARGAVKIPMLPPTFTPDGQWQLLLKPDWQLLRGPATPKAAAVGRETKDAPTEPSAFEPESGPGDLGQHWQLQSAAQRSAAQRPQRQRPPPRTAPLTPASDPFTCDPLICHQRMEVIHVSSRGLPGAEIPTQPQEAELRSRVIDTGLVN